MRVFASRCRQARDCGFAAVQLESIAQDTSRENREVAPATVLLLHSRSDARDMYADYLRENGYAVTVADSSDEALTLIASVDALITGLMVPGSIEPVDLIRHVRSDLSNLPIVVVTAVSERIVQAARAGADVVLVKPCLPDRLIVELRKAMDRGDRRETASHQ